MKKILFLVTLLLSAMQMTAANVDAATAKATAERYLSNVKVNGRHLAPTPSSEFRLAHTEFNSLNTSQAVYYIFNTNDRYIIVSGDDRAREVLAWGDGNLDVNNIPCNMAVWLEGYKHQLEYLQSHPDMRVNNGGPRRASANNYETVQPLITALWDQGEPYNRECPLSGDKHCLTGCGATALSMIFHHWKYPNELTQSVPAYSTGGMNIETLPPTTFDWGNMLDTYHGGYNDEQASAVAHLMRYVGQSERMDYGVESSGTGSYNILQTVMRFGYDQDVQLISKENWWGENNYTDEEWGTIIQEELSNHRPILMCAYTITWSGHAFVIDGYDAEADTYHVNWGWSGSANNHFVLNAFNGGGMIFNVGQQLIIGLEPPVTVPTIKAWTSRVSTRAYVDSTAVSSFTVKGALLTDDVTLTLNDESGFFSIDTERITTIQLQNGKRVTVTYKPTTVGTHSATVVLKSAGAEDKVVQLNGNCLLETYDPVMLEATDVTQSSFNIQWQDGTPKHNVVSYNLEIAPVPFYEKRQEESFDKTENTGTSSSDCSSKLDEITHTPGWTGSKLYRTNTDLLMGTTKSKGWIETPALDMYGNNGLITVKVSAKCSGGDTSSPLKVSCGDKDTTIYVTSEEDVYTALLPCPAIENAKVKLSNVAGKRIVLCDIEIYAGDNFTPVDLSRAVYKEGITSTNFVMENLLPGYYGLRVQTLYTDGELSPWSNRTRAFIAWLRGDVNHDGEINVADVNQIVDAITCNIKSTRALDVCDINGDQEINIADINAIIDKITGN